MGDKKHATQDSKEIPEIFDSIINGLHKKVTTIDQPITVDLEVRFTGVEISQSGVLKRIGGTTTKEKNQTEINLATQIILEPKQSE